MQDATCTEVSYTWHIAINNQIHNNNNNNNNNQNEPVEVEVP
jgi:hypothetical protein